MLAMLVLHRAKLLASNQSVLALGVAPMRVVSRWCRCVVQRLCATDCKRPCLVRAAAPHSAPARMPGVYAQRLCTMQSQQSIHSPSPRGRGLGLGIINQKFISKTDFFYNLQREFNPLLLLFYPFLFSFRVYLPSRAAFMFSTNLRAVSVMR